MKLIYPRCGVLAVQGETVLACLRIQEADGPAHDEVRTFGILLADLVTLSEWLAAHGVTHVAIEGTSHVWKPIYRILQQTFTVLRIDAGRVTDATDIGRVAALVAYGLEPCRVIRLTSVQEPPRRHKRQLITMGAVMLSALLATYWVWKHPTRADSQHPPVPSPARMVQWQQPQVAYQHPAGKPFTFPLPALQRSPEGAPVEVGLDASGDRPSWLQVDRKQLSIRGIAPNIAEEKTYQLILRAQAEHASESRLHVSLTIKGQPEPPASSLAAAAPSPAPPQAPQSRPSKPPPQSAPVSTISQQKPPDASVAAAAPSSPPLQTPELLPSASLPEKGRLLTILKGDPPPSPESAEALPLPPAQAPQPLPSDRPADKDCLLRTLRGESCVSSR